MVEQEIVKEKLNQRFGGNFGDRQGENPRVMEVSH